MSASATQPVALQSRSEKWIQDQNTIIYSPVPGLEVTGPSAPSDQRGFPFTFLHRVWSFVLWALLLRALALEVLQDETPRSTPPSSSGQHEEDLFNRRSASPRRGAKPSLRVFESSYSMPPPSLTTNAPTSAHQLKPPDQMWEVLSSWTIQNPTRSTIPNSFDDDTQKDKVDLILTQTYKTSFQKQYLALSEDLLAAEKLLNKLEHAEVALLLSIEQVQPESLMVGSIVALAVAKAARRTVNARMAVSEIQLSKAKLDVQKLIDTVEEQSAMSLEVDHQLHSIMAAFRLSGWNLTRLPAYSAGASIFPLPPLLSTLKTLVPDTHPYLSGSVKSLSARSSGSVCFSL